MKWSFIPGYDEAVRAEESVRVASFLDAPRPLIGVDVRPLTLRDMLLLDAARSPFMHGGVVDAADIVLALWILSDDRVAGRSRRRFVRRCRKIRYEEAVRAVGEYIEESLQDSPESGGNGDSTPTKYWIADMVHLFASNYGWSESSILDLPIARALQYQRAIRAAKDPKTLFINARSDRVKGDWLKKLNKVPA